MKFVKNKMQYNQRSMFYYYHQEESCRLAVEMVVSVAVTAELNAETFQDVYPKIKQKHYYM